MDAAAWQRPESPPILADGKIYVGTDGGQFFIIVCTPTGRKS